MDELIRRIREKAGRTDECLKEGDRVADLLGPPRHGKVHRIEEVWSTRVIDVLWDDGELERGRGVPGLKKLAD